MKAQFLKISGHKNEKDFYKEFPTQESFLAKHGAALKKAQGGYQFPSAQFPQQPNQQYQMNQDSVANSLATLQNFNNNFTTVNNGQGYSGMLQNMFSGGDAGNGGLSKSFGDIGKSFGFGNAKGDSFGNAGSYVNSAIDIASGISGLKGEKNMKRKARRDNEVIGIVKDAYDSEDINKNQDYEDNFARTRKALMPVQYMDDYAQHGGGLSRDKNYGSKSHPYPSVSSGDFAGGGRSYPIPTKADAVDALRLAGLHGRSDVKSKVYSKYPELKKSNHGGEIMNTYAPGTLYDDLETAQYGWNSWNNIGTGMQTIAQNQQMAGMANNLGSNTNIGKVNNAYGQIGKGAGTAIGSFFGGPLGGKLGGIVGEQFGRFDPNYKKIKNYNEQKQQKLDYMMNSNGFQGARMNVAGAYTKDGGVMRSGGKLRTNEVGDIQALSGGYLEPISYNPYSDGTGITSMIKGQSHEESNGVHSGVLLNYGEDKAAHGSSSADVEAEDGEPVTEIGNNAVIFGDMKVNRLTVGDDPMFKNFYGKTFKKAAEGITEKNVQLGKERDKLTYELDAYSPKTAIEKLKGNSLQARTEALDLKYKVNDAAIRKLAANQEVVHDVTNGLNLNSGQLSRNKLELEKKDVAQGGKNVKRTPVTPFMNTLASKPMTVDITHVPAPGPINIQQPYVEPEDTEEITSNNSLGIDTLYAMAAPWFRRPTGEQLNNDQISGELNALADNDVEPVQARFYHPQLRDPNSQVSFQDQRNDNQADFNQLARIASYNPEALSALAAQKYNANSKISGEEFRVNQGQREQIAAQNQATLNDALMKNLQLADQQYVRQATSKSATKAVRQEALNSISSKIAQNRLENRTLQVYENMFPDYSFDNNFRINKTGAPAVFNTQMLNASKKGADTNKKARNGNLVKAFRDI
jgi:hypothetical protein